MPLQNRVTPLGELVADPARGLVYGNRGCLHDEAGHRPCALCRREDYRRFLAIWRQVHPGRTGADAIDERLHRERVGPDRRTRLHEVRFDELPAFVSRGGAPYLVHDGALLRWTPAGYIDRTSR